MEAINKLIKYVVEATGYRRILLLAALALVSALLSRFAVADPWKILFVNWPHAIGAPTSIAKEIHDFKVPLLPGIYFGFALALGAYAWKRNNLFAVSATLFGTVIAWIVAVEISYSAVLYLNYLYPTTPGTLPNLIASAPPIPFLIFAGIVGGFVGGALTLVGISFVIPDFRTINNWSRTLLVASLAGALLAQDTNNFTILLIVWQVSVAASIAFGWSFQETLKVASRSGKKSKR